MTDPITDRTTQILAATDHVLVPITDLYRQLASEGLMSRIPLSLYEDLIAADERFEVYAGLSDSNVFNPIARAQLQARGLLGGPLVLLKNRGVTSEAVMLDVLLYLQELNKALETAWYLRPQDNTEVEAELLTLLMMGDMVERQIKEALKSHAVEKRMLRKSDGKH